MENEVSGFRVLGFHHFFGFKVLRFRVAGLRV